MIEFEESTGNVYAAGHSESDADCRMPPTHEAATHDAWFRAEVEAGLKEADDPATPLIPHEEILARWFKRRAELTQTLTSSPC